MGLIRGNNVELQEARQWLEQLRSAVNEGRISYIQACDEVFAEMENGDHDATVETLFYNFTRTI